MPPSEVVCLVLFSNPGGDISINDFRLAGHVVQLWLTLPKMAPLSAILSGLDNSTSIWWVWKGSTNTLATASALLCLCSWLIQQYQVAAPITFHTGKHNQLSNSQLCSLFDLIFPQATSWQMLHMTSAQKQGLSRWPLPG
jgi:hypothetical protein